MKSSLPLQKNSAILLFLVFIIALPAQEPMEEHKISVNAMLIPVFAVDSKGDPVYDLEKEEFKLFVNSKPVEIMNLLRFTFEEDKEVVKTIKIKKEIPVKERTERFVFIILDSVFNSFHGYRRAKKIAEGIVTNGSPDDIFIVLENVGTGGLRYIAGTEQDRKEIIKKIRKLKVPTSKWDRSLFLTRPWNDMADTQKYNPGNDGIERSLKYKDQLLYKQQVKHFSRNLRQFKYALKTIVKPKIVFLVSEGIAKNAFKTDYALIDRSPAGAVSVLKPEPTVKDVKHFFDQRLFQYLKDMVTTINEGGSVFYTIHPGKFERDEGASGEMSLRYLASEGGGKFIGGSDTKDIIRHVKRTTAAYYELAFMTDDNMGKKLDIDVKCTREGVKLHTFEKTEKGTAYNQMAPLEKKLFAFNAATGGSWSRMVGKVVRVKYKKHKQEKPGAPNKIPIEIQLPEAMKNRKLDIHVLHYDPKTMKTEIDFKTKILGENVLLALKSKNDTSDFFVIIEPVNVYCIYNEVK
jgi:VWFA-related protein